MVKILFGCIEKVALGIAVKILFFMHLLLTVPNLILTANGYVYGVVWRFEEQTCQTATPFIRCKTLEISTIRQMHYTRCYRLVFFVFRHFSFNLLLLSVCRVLG